MGGHRSMARNTMAKDGPLKPDSPRGVWEIPTAGRQWLEKLE